MVCSTCGGVGSSSGGSGCCNLKAMDVVTPLNSIRNGDANFCFTEITDQICENLKNDEGLNPSATHSNTDCDDLSSLNDLATGSLHNALMILNLCDVDAYKCWLDSLLSWQWNVDKAIICAICGIWKKLEWLESIIIDRSGYATVTKVYTYTVPVEKFVRNLSNAEMWWSGSPDVGESFISIPVAEMDLVDVVTAQPQVAGGYVHAVTVAVQSAVKQGDNYVVNFDTYEIEGNQVDGSGLAPFAVTIKFVVTGRKKVI